MASFGGFPYLCAATLSMGCRLPHGLTAFHIQIVNFLCSQNLSTTLAQRSSSTLAAHSTVPIRSWIYEQPQAATRVAFFRVRFHPVDRRTVGV